MSLSPRSRRVVLTGHLASREAPTGAERSLALLAAGLARRGHRVTVLAPGPWCLSGELEEAGVQVRVVPTRPCWLTYWGSRPLPVVLWKGVRCAAAMRAVTRLAAALAELQPDVVVVNCLPHLAAAAAARRLGRPWLWYLREILPPGWRRRYFARRLVASGAVLVGVSEAVRAWVVGEQPSALVDVVYNGVPIPAEVPEAPAVRLALGLPEGGVWVGYLGQLAPHKGVRLFLESVAQASAAVRGLRALVAGPGSSRQQRQVQRWGRQLLGERCTVLPPQQEVVPLLAACDVVCVPTLTPDPAPRVVLEAMAVGRPVVASSSGGIPELIRHGLTGWLLTKGEELPEALVRVGGDATLRQRMGQAGRRRAAEWFSLERHVTCVEEKLLAVGDSIPPLPSCSKEIT
ncbi:MAG: glycosyltransferase family 4 protein [Acidobacteriota bacterium]